MKDRAPPQVAVFGGSFNPVHEGHVGIVRVLAEDPELSAVIVMPARRSPFKRSGELLPDAVRWAMLRGALRGLPGVSLSDLELRRPAPSYTVATLRTLSAMLPAAGLHFALGWDAFAEFAGWHRAPELLSLAGLIVFARAGSAFQAPADPAAWLGLLPSPWREQARPAGSDRLATPGGRILVRRLGLPLPAVAASEIRSARTLQGVPAGAREVLADYWQRTEAR